MEGDCSFLFGDEFTVFPLDPDGLMPEGAPMGLEGPWGSGCFFDERFGGPIGPRLLLLLEFERGGTLISPPGPPMLATSV